MAIKNQPNHPVVGVGDMGDFGIDPIPSKYMASIAYTNTFNFKFRCIIESLCAALFWDALFD